MSGNFAIKGGGGVGPLMANAILNFHFDFLHTSLTCILVIFCTDKNSYSHIRCLHCARSAHFSMSGQSLRCSWLSKHLFRGCPFCVLASISHHSHWGISHISFKTQIVGQIFRNIICLGTVHKCDETHTTLLGVISLQLMSSLDRFKSKISKKKILNEWNAQNSLKWKINIKSLLVWGFLTP